MKGENTMKKKKMKRVTVPRVRKNKRNRTLQRAVKEQLFEVFGSICMVCKKEKERKELQLHHLVPHRESGTTTFEDSSLVCEHCHHVINYNDVKNKREYERINASIYEYKKNYLVK